MRPVNLLPPSERPRAVREVPPNASKAVVVVLGVLLLAVAGWVFTKNQVSGRTGDIATANKEKAEADQRTQGLQAFGDFAQIKQTRVESVSELASERFDWERFMRELALVLPSKVWVSNVTAGGDATTTASAGAPPDPQAAAASSGSRTIGLSGCAPSQKAVAETIVRLRGLYGADDVVLKDSKRADESTTGAPSGTSDSAEGGAASCMRYYAFSASISFTAQKSAGKDKRVRAPSRLGGGA